MCAQIPQSSEGKAWYSYVDPTVTSAMLEGAIIYIWYQLDSLLVTAAKYWMQWSFQIVCNSS